MKQKHFTPQEQKGRGHRMKAPNAWICPQCGALITPLHSRCHRCGRVVDATTKFAMLVSIGFVAGEAVRFAFPASPDARPRTRSQISADQTKGHPVKGNLYRAELSCPHPAWVRGEAPGTLIGKTVRCGECPPGNNLRKVTRIQFQA